MADPEIHPSESAHKAGDKPAPGSGKNKNAFFEKHKIAILALGAGILVAAFFVFKSKSSTSSTASPATANIDPATGYPYGSAADLAALGQTTANSSGSGGGGGYGGGGNNSGAFASQLASDISADLSPSAVAASGGSGTTTSTPVTGTGSTSDTEDNLSYTTPAGTVNNATPAQFLAAFQATGQNAGQVVPGGTGKPIPLPPGKSYTHLWLLLIQCRLLFPPVLSRNGISDRCVRFIR
jgi:hypothetical protein